MKDRIDDYSKRLKEMGKEVDYVEFKGEQHGFFVNQPFSQVAYKVLEEIKLFMTKNSLWKGFCFHTPPKKYEVGRVSRFCY